MTSIEPSGTRSLDRGTNASRVYPLLRPGFPFFSSFKELDNNPKNKYNPRYRHLLLVRRELEVFILFWPLGGGDLDKLGALFSRPCTHRPAQVRIKLRMC